MDENFYRFWDDPLAWVVEQCKRLGVSVPQLVYREAEVDASLWRRWCRSECAPTMLMFQRIVYAIERREPPPAPKKGASRRQAR